MLPNWLHCWRVGVEPLLSTVGLLALRKGLVEDDDRLIQGATTTPPPMQCTQDWPVEAACALGYVGWIGDGLETVGEVEEWFSRMCYEIDQLLNEPAGCRYFLSFFDDSSRETLLHEFLPEIDAAIARRGVVAA